ncbi:MAG: ATP synthase F1 subunit epsilon [Patescibacteria group bacterium]|nr:ATP synthase F1 subunit epsilon [Patescibacteria group bacterium]
MDKFLLEIITPERIAYQEEVDMVVVPATKGQAGVLAHHMPYFSQLTEGELKIVKDNEEYFLSIGGGFLDVNPNKTTILVTRAIHAEEINEKDVLEAKKAAEEALAGQPTGQALDSARALLRRSLMDLKVLQRRQGRVTGKTRIGNIS